MTTATLADQAYEQVRSAIGAGELRPGVKVTERGMAERLAISPTPVREALRRLELDGLIERIGPRTVQVASIHSAAVDDLAEVEIGLRGLVARFAARHATPDQLDELDRILDRADDLLILIRERQSRHEVIERHVGELFETIQRFNAVVIECAHNPVLARMVEQSRVFSVPQRRQVVVLEVMKTGTWSLERYRSHRELVQALRARDSIAAEGIALEDVQGGLAAIRAAL